MITDKLSYPVKSTRIVSNTERSRLSGQFRPSNRPFSALISNLGSFPWGSSAMLMLTDACMIREGSQVRLQGTLPSDYQHEPPGQAGRPPGRGFGYAIPFTRQATIYYPELCQQCPTPSDPLRRRKKRNHDIAYLTVLLALSLGIFLFVT